MRAALFALLLAPAPLAPTLAATQAHAETVVIGTSATYPPIIIHDGGAPVSGLEGDIMSLVCARAGWTCRWEIMPFDTVFAALEAGHIDVAANSLGHTPARAARVHLTCPYRPAAPDDILGSFFIRDPHHDPRSGPIAVLRGTLHHAALVEAGLDARLFLEDRAALDAVVAEALPAYFGPSVAVEHHPSGGTLTRADDMPVHSGGTAFAVSPHRPDLAAALDAQLTDLSHEGIITALTRQWTGEAVDDPIALCQTSPQLS